MLIGDFFKECLINTAMAKGDKLVLKDIENLLEQDSLKVMSDMALEINPIQEFIKKTKNKSLKKSLTNYVVIRLVSIIESYFRNSVRELIDSELFDAKGLLVNDEIIISLLDLDSIKQNSRITKGRIIVNSINFQNLDKINEVVSQIMGGEKYFTRFNKMMEDFETTKKIRMLGKKQTKKENEKPFDWKEFRELFDNRHDIIHRMGASIEIDQKKLLRYISNSSTFLGFTEVIIVQELEGRLKASLDPKLLPKLKDRLTRVQTALASMTFTDDVKSKTKHKKIQKQHKIG